MRRTCTLYPAIAAVLLLICANPALACHLEIKIYIDISGSTSAKDYLAKFLEDLAELTEKPRVEIVPFAGAIYAACRPLGPLDWTRGAFPQTCERAQIIQAVRGDTEKQKTNLFYLIESIQKDAEASVPDDVRRIILVFSDFVQSTSLDERISFLDWVNNHEEPLSRLASALSTSAIEVKLVSQPPKDRNPDRVTEVKDMATFLKGKSFDLWEADFDLESRTKSEVAEDPRPLSIQLLELSLEKLTIDVQNPSCKKREGVNYRLMRTDGRASFEIPRAPEACTNVRPTKGVPIRCELPLPKLPSNRECPQYEVHATPSNHRAAAKSKAFTGYPCFRVHSAWLDVAPDGGQSALPSECLQENLNVLEENDSDLAKRTLGLPFTLLSTENRKWVGFAACIEASGLLQPNVQKQFIFEEIRSESSQARIVIKPPPINMDRFSLISTPIDSHRYFPVFAWTKLEDARALCYNAHDERPSRVAFGEQTAEQNLPLTTLLILKRDRDREAEEELHSAWESLLFPLGALGFLATLAIRGARRSSSAALEEYLGILAFGLLAVAAILHDVTNVGDTMEQLFSQAPGQFTAWGLVSLSIFFLYWVSRGAFEPKRNKSVASIEFGMARLNQRRRRFHLRTAIWLLFIALIIGWTGERVYRDPKRIEECLFKGRVQVKQGVSP